MHFQGRARDGSVIHLETSVDVRHKLLFDGWAVFTKSPARSEPGGSSITLSSRLRSVAQACPDLGTSGLVTGTRTSWARFQQMMRIVDLELHRWSVTAAGRSSSAGARDEWGCRSCRFPPRVALPPIDHCFQGAPRRVVSDCRMCLNSHSWARAGELGGRERRGRRRPGGIRRRH